VNLVRDTLRQAGFVDPAQTLLAIFRSFIDAGRCPVAIYRA